MGEIDFATSSLLTKTIVALGRTALKSVTLEWEVMDGRVGSDVDEYWIYNGVTLGADLMAFRTKTMENNGGLPEPHQKL
ncbi:hypothetical protein BGX21_007999 [Mortierella sp. AD011]|nr:hypothetical protein BGX21_007999 [Mortierella sp. AD011]